MQSQSPLHSHQCGNWSKLVCQLLKKSESQLVTSCHGTYKLLIETLKQANINPTQQYSQFSAFQIPSNISEKFKNSLCFGFYLDQWKDTFLDQNLLLKDQLMKINSLNIDFSQKCDLAAEELKKYPYDKRDNTIDHYVSFIKTERQNHYMILHSWDGIFSLLDWSSIIRQKQKKFTEQEWKQLKNIDAWKNPMEYLWYYWKKIQAEQTIGIQTSLKLMLLRTARCYFYA